MSEVESRKNYVAQPPTPVFSWNHFLDGLRSGFVNFFNVFKDTFAYFPRAPQNFDDPPEADSDLDSQIVEQCAEMLQRSQEARKVIEEKARSMFTIVSFLVPLVSAGLIYLLGHPQASHFARWTALLLFILSEAFLLLSFYWITKTVGIKTNQVLGASSILRATTFRKYNAGFHAQGMLYCAVWNDAMNALFAQFVRNAHILIVAAVCSGSLAAFPLGIVYSASSDSDTAKKEQADQAEERLLSSLKDNLSELHADMRATNSMLDQENRLSTLEEKLSELQATLQAHDKKSSGEHGIKTLRH